MDKEDRFLGWHPSQPDFRDIIFAAPRQILEALPPAVDLSVPSIPSPWVPAWNQGRLGACGPHAIAGDIVFAGMRQQGLTTFPMPSRLFIYWCTRYLMGTTNSDSGVDNRTLLKALAQFGWCDEELWPYNINNFRTQPSQACFDQAEKRKIVQYQSVPQNLETMKGCVAGGDPFVFGWSVYSSISQADETGMIPMPSRNDSLEGGHDVLIIGYNDGPGMMLGIPARHLKFRNWWLRGANVPWGQNSYGFIPYEYAANPQLSGDFWTVKHSAYIPVTPDPTPVPIPPTPTPTPVPVPPTPPENNFMDTLLKILDSALTLFEKYAKTTPDTQDDAIASVLRMVLTVLETWFKTGNKPSDAQLDALHASIKARIASTPNKITV